MWMCLESIKLDSVCKFGLLFTDINETIINFNYLLHGVHILSFFGGRAPLFAFRSEVVALKRL